jgi:hypothetical protein
MATIPMPGAAQVGARAARILDAGPGRSVTSNWAGPSFRAGHTTQVSSHQEGNGPFTIATLPGRATNADGALCAASPNFWPPSR